MFPQQYSEQNIPTDPDDKPWKSNGITPLILLPDIRDQVELLHALSVSELFALCQQLAIRSRGAEKAFILNSIIPAHPQVSKLDLFRVEVARIDSIRRNSSGRQALELLEHLELLPPPNAMNQEWVQSACELMHARAWAFYFTALEQPEQQKTLNQSAVEISDRLWRFASNRRDLLPIDQLAYALESCITLRQETSLGIDQISELIAEYAQIIALMPASTLRIRAQAQYHIMCGMRSLAETNYDAALTEFTIFLTMAEEHLGDYYSLAAAVMSLVAYTGCGTRAPQQSVSHVVDRIVRLYPLSAQAQRDLAPYLRQIAAACDLVDIRVSALVTP